MITFLIGLFIGFFIGGTLGVLVMALMNMTDEMNHYDLNDYERRR